MIEILSPTDFYKRAFRRRMMDMPLPKRVRELRELSLIAFSFERLFRALQYLPPQRFLKHRAGKPVEKPLTKEELRAQTRRDARSRDIYISVWLIVLAASIAGSAMEGAPRYVGWGVQLLALLRIVDIVQTAGNISIFDPLRLEGTHRVASMARTFILSLVNYLELIFWFALVYTSRPGLLRAGDADVTRFVDCLYFSIVTQLTIGYGDILPIGAGRLIASAQGMISFFFTLVILGRVVTLLPRLESRDGDLPRGGAEARDA